MRSQAVIGFCVFVIGIFAAYQMGGKISGGDMGTVEFAAFGFASIWVGITILKNWRLGTYLFLIWILFEDLVRKYLGNNMAIYFGKDVLVGLVFVSILTEVRRGRVKLFRPPFLLFLYFFLFLGALEIFNSNSPSVLYGLMGFKLYFYYMPLMFVGYALIRNDEDLRKFLVFNVWLAGMVGVIGIIQAILGHSFLNPANLAPELKDLGELDRYTPLTNQLVSIPSSVFVSAGRYSLYLVLGVCAGGGNRGIFVPVHYEEPQIRISRAGNYGGRHAVLRVSRSRGVRFRQLADSGRRLSVGCAVALAAGPSHVQSNAPRLHRGSAGPHRNSLDLSRRSCPPHSFLHGDSQSQ